MNFFGVLSNEGVHLGQSWFQHIWRVEQFASHGTHRISQKSMFAENHVLQCHAEPNSICDKNKLRPAMEPTERNAGASANINSLKEDEATAR